MSRYQVLCSVLDTIIKSAPSNFAKSYPTNTPELRNSSKSKAYIHLFLQSQFGLTDFKDRHDRITDGANDGGIDAFHIDTENATLYLVQSKFRTVEHNYSEKQIDPNELASMDIDRILEGNDDDEHGNKYNGKIKKLQQLFSEATKLRIKIIILANVDKLDAKTITRLIDKHSYEIFDYARTYREILFPVCSGNYYNPNEISVEIQTDTGSRADSYQYISTKSGEYSVRLLFAPLIEIGKQLNKYKNALLKYNPRNFLSLTSNPVNKEIVDELKNNAYNNFALLNNGITFVAEKDDFQDKTGVKGKGRLKITKPQIINGGQTAFAIASLIADGRESALKNKSVLIKIITPEEGKSLDIALMESISNANNRQSKIVEADRRSNIKRLLDIQDHIFEYYSMFFERKRGEFEDGVKNKFIKKSEIIDRVEFIRSVCSFIGKAAKARSSQENIFEEELFSLILSPTNIDSMMFAYRLKTKLVKAKFAPGMTYAVIAAIGHCIDRDKITPQNIEKLLEESDNITKKWNDYINWASGQIHNSKYLLNGKVNDNYYKAEGVDADIKKYFKRKNTKWSY